MAIEIFALREEHLAEAASLVTARYRTQREATPSLPARYEQRGEILPLLKELARKERGVAAASNGRLTGFMAGMPIPDWRGHRAAWSPEWANAAEQEGEAETYYAMYERLAPEWIADDRLSHLVSVFSHDPGAMGALGWLGFSFVAVDAMRGVSPIDSGGANPEITRAGAKDAETSMRLSRELAETLEGAPVFLHRMREETRREHEDWIANVPNALFLARLGGELVGHMRLVPSNPTAAYVIRDKGTISISGAHVKRELRGSGIGTALLAYCINWAGGEGYERCSVDFEPENVRGRLFWLRHFSEFCRAYCRRIDERLGPPGEKQGSRKAGRRDLRECCGRGYISIRGAGTG